MKILIVGGHGMVGSELTRQLTALGVEVDRPTREDLDIMAPEAWFFERDIYDAAVNLAAFHNVDGCQADPVTAYNTNATGAGEFAQMCAERAVAHFYISTDYVFGGWPRSDPDHSGYMEGSHPRPLNIYGMSKALGESAVINNDGTVVRTSALFGFGGSAQKSGNFVDRMIQRAKESPEVHVVNDQRTAPTYVPDLVSLFIKHALGIGGRRIAAPILHIVNSGSATWYELAYETIKVAAEVGLIPRGIPVYSKTSEEFRAPAKRPSFSVLRSEFSELQGLRPWQDALRAYLVAKKERENQNA